MNGAPGLTIRNKNATSNNERNKGLLSPCALSEPQPITVAAPRTETNTVEGPSVSVPFANSVVSLKLDTQHQESPAMCSQTPEATPHLVDNPHLVDLATGEGCLCGLDFWQ